MVETNVTTGIEQILHTKAVEIYGRNYQEISNNITPDIIESATGKRIDPETLQKSNTTESGGNVNFWPSKMYAVDMDPLGLPRQKEKHKNRAFMIDPNYNMMNWAGGRMKPSSISFSTLRLMSYRCPQIRGIINTRINQLSQIEWDIKLKDSNTRPNLMQQEKIDYIKRILEYPIDNKANKQNWRTFIKATTEDSLVLDAFCFEKVMNRRGLIRELYAIDGSTIFPNSNEYGEADPVAAYLQMIRGIKVAEFTRKDVTYGIRHPRTDIYAYGYGLSELEMLIDVVTSILFVDKYNRSYFTNNSIPDGVLSLAGEMDPQDLEAFKRYWISEVKGIDNFWKMPILNVPDKTSMNWIDFKKTNREMQFNIYYDWLTRVACAVYQIDPAEINVHGQPGMGAAGHGGGGTVAKVEYSKDKGLRDLVLFTQDLINMEVVDELWPELKFIYTGVDAMTKPEKVDIRTKQLQGGLKTINEFRKEDNEEPLPWGDIPLNPTLAMAYQQQQAQKQQEQQQQAMQEQQGQPGMEGQPEQEQAQQGQPGQPQPQGQPGQEQYMPQEEQAANKTGIVKKLGPVNDKTKEMRHNVGTKASVIDEVQRRNIMPNTMTAGKPMRKSIEECDIETVDTSEVIRITMEI